MAKQSKEERQVALASLIYSSGLSSRSEVRDAAKQAGLYSSEGNFSRDIAAARRAFGGEGGYLDQKTNYGGGRKNVVVNGAKYRIGKRVSPDEMEPGKVYGRSRRGKPVELIFNGNVPRPNARSNQEEVESIFKVLERDGTVSYMDEDALHNFGDDGYNYYRVS